MALHRKPSALHYPRYHSLNSEPFSNRFETQPLAQRDPEVTTRPEPPLVCSPVQRFS